MLLIDEASQVRPEEALGAIARCRQIVVVGDKKQLPPTNFFRHISEESEEESVEEVQTVSASEMESVLTLCEARGLNSAMLQWHYRSRDPSLIMVNNAEFYDDRLILPQSPLQNDSEYGLKFCKVQGVYNSPSRGTDRKRTNIIEAEAVVKAVAEHARKFKSLSLKVVVFSKAQSDILTELLERARRKDEILDEFLREGNLEDVFVKNIENVQGDERDVILISAGYGPANPGGRLASMSFGPVNKEGGERRLNVLFSRARIRCVVFCSFDPNDINTSRTKAPGPAVLKSFLEFARSGKMVKLTTNTSKGILPESPLEEDVADVIYDLGYPFDYQVGEAGFRIDLGVRDPDQPSRYILAVECDGATYHSALCARERDRLRQDVLEGFGWVFHRIWRTDWFYRREDEIEWLKSALKKAKFAERTVFPGANKDGISSQREEPDPIVEENEEESGEEVVLPTPTKPSVRAYVLFTEKVDMKVEPRDAPIERLTELVIQIVEVEGPIHQDLVARRVSSAFGKVRAGRRIQEASDKALKRADRSEQVFMEEKFAMTRLNKAPPVRDRSGKDTTAKAEMLPPMQIYAAALRVVKENREMLREDIIIATARIFGFAKTGKELHDQIDRALPNDQE